MAAALFLIPVLFVVLGIVFSCGKGASLIAGYNTEPEWKRKKYDERALCRFMGKMMFSMAACMVVFSLGILYNKEKCMAAGLILFFVVCIGGVIYMNVGKKFKK